MADTVQEITQLEDGAPCRVIGTISRVYPMADGVAKNSGKRWYRQDFLLGDQTGTTKVSWFNPGGTETMNVLDGAYVEVTGKVNIYKGEVQVKASFDEAVKSVESREPVSASEATNPPQSISTPPQGQNVAHRTSQTRQTGGLSQGEYEGWIRERWEVYEQLPGIQRAIERGEPVAGVIRDLIGAEWMSRPPEERNVSLRDHPTATTPSPEPARPEGGASPTPSGGSAHDLPDDDTDIPF